MRTTTFHMEEKSQSSGQPLRYEPCMHASYTYVVKPLESARTPMKELITVLCHNLHIKYMLLVMVLLRTKYVFHHTIWVRIIVDNDTILNYSCI